MATSFCMRRVSTTFCLFLHGRGCMLCPDWPSSQAEGQRVDLGSEGAQVEDTEGGAALQKSESVEEGEEEADETSK